MKAGEWRSGRDVNFNKGEGGREKKEMEKGDQLEWEGEVKRGREGRCGEVKVAMNDELVKYKINESNQAQTLRSSSIVYLSNLGSRYNGTEMKTAAKHSYDVSLT